MLHNKDTNCTQTTDFFPIQVQHHVGLFQECQLCFWCRLKSTGLWGQHKKVKPLTCLIGSGLFRTPLSTCLQKVHTSDLQGLTWSQSTILLNQARVHLHLLFAGFPCMDLMALEEEPPPRKGQEIQFWPLERTKEVGRVTPAAVEILHRVYLENGQVGRRHYCCNLFPTFLHTGYA